MEDVNIWKKKKTTDILSRSAKMFWKSIEINAYFKQDS